MAAGQEPRAELLVVVDLAVEHDVDGPILVRHRLMPAGHVDDAEAAHADGDARRDVIPVVVGPAMPNGVAHAAEPVRGVRRVGRATGEAGYSAHGGLACCPPATGSPMRVEAR